MSPRWGWRDFGYAGYISMPLLADSGLPAGSTGGNERLSVGTVNRIAYGP
jgi:hypothetical protein